MLPSRFTYTHILRDVIFERKKWYKAFESKAAEKLCLPAQICLWRQKAPVCYGTVQTASDVFHQLTAAWRGRGCAQMGIACKIILMPTCLQQRQWLHAPVKVFSCPAPLPFKTRCSSWCSLGMLQGCSNKAEVRELKQTSPHTSTLSKPPARAWGRDQQTVGLLTIPCFIPPRYVEPESKWLEGERLVSTLECLRVNSEGFLYLGVCIKKWDSWKRNWSKNILIKIVVLLRMLNLLIIIYEIKDWLPL